MSDDRTRDLAEKPIGRLLWQYSLPAIAGMVIFSLYNIIDSIFIGHGAGALAISGLAITFPIMNLSLAVGMLVGIGGASIISIRLGQKKEEEAGHVLGNVLVLSAIFGVAFGLLSLLFLDGILVAFGASPQTLPYARAFLQVILAGLPVSFLFFNLNHVMRATGYPKKAMLSAVVTVGVNVVLAPIFIFIFEWGIRGAAMATIIAQVVGLAWVLSHFFSSASFIRFRPGIYRPCRKIIRGIFSIGMSPFLFNVCACVVVLVINLELKTHGGDLAIGAYGIINRLLLFLVMVVVGLTQGMQPILGYNYGARRMDRLKLTLRYGILTATGITTAGFLAAQLCPRVVASLFAADQGLIELATTGLHLSTIILPFVGSQIVIGNFFQSISQARTAIFLSLSRQLLFLLPCLLILPNFLGLNGVWLSLPIADALSVFVGFTYLRRFLKMMNVPPMRFSDGGGGRA